VNDAFYPASCGELTVVVPTPNALSDALSYQHVCPLKF